MHFASKPLEATRPVTGVICQGECLPANRSRRSVYFLHPGVARATSGRAWNAGAIGLAWPFRHANGTRHPVGSYATFEQT